jgi:hypothetical protein
MKLVLAQTGEQAVALEKLIEEQRDPNSANYHNWLTPEEFGDRFGVSEGDLAALSAWLQSHGFVIEQVARARNWIAFSGTAGQVESAFQTEIHKYEVDGGTHFANAGPPSVPAVFASVIGEVRGLNDFRPSPPRTSKIKANPDFNSSNGLHYLGPNDLATIYDISPLYTAGFNGAGQSLVIAGQTDINLSDIQGFRSTFGLPSNTPQLVLYGADPGVSSQDQVEADLDLEWSGAIARNATIIYVYSQNVFESVQYAVDQNLAPVISVSYGACEAGVSSSSRSIAQQANAEGITWMNASGDSGAAGCDWGVQSATHGPSVSFPADIPEVTAVGGTEFNEGSGSYWSSQSGTGYLSALSYIPEIAWNDTATANELAASGGGASILFAKPWWQSGSGVPSDGARDVPDVSLSASGVHDGYVIYVGGLMAVGGTSASTPAFAGIVTLLNQYVVSKGLQSKPGLGNINPNLYGLAQNTTGVFHDITTGSNIVPCTSGSTGCTTGSFGYSAGKGYDLVTGLGSVDAYNLATHWAGQSTLIGTTTSVSASSTSITASGSTQITATVAPASGSTLPSGSVTFSVGSTTLGSASLVTSGSSAKAVLTVSGSSLASGSNTITATYAATGSFSSSSGSTVVTVAASTVTTTTALTAASSSITTSGSTQLTATVKAASGSAAPSGTVTFSLGSKSLGSATLSASSGSGGTATAVLTVSGSSLAIGSNSIVASFGGSTGFSASTSSAVTVTVTAPLVSTTLSVSASPASFAQSATTVLTATVKAASGTAGPSGSVTYTTGSVTLGSATLTASGTTSTASLTVKGSSLALGSDSITATYAANSTFAGSTGTVTVSVSSSGIATTTTLSANPTSISQSSTTQFTATVKAGSGSTSPAGSVAFMLGSTALGTVTLSSGTASLTVTGSSLAIGTNQISAVYQPSSTSFTTSTGTVTVTVQSAAVTTTTTLSASPTSISQSSTTQLTATVKASSGSTSPAGSVEFMLGSTALGTVTLSSGTASLTVKGSSLAVGTNQISAVYQPSSTSFATSTGSATVTVQAQTITTTTTVSASSTTVSTGGTTVITASVKPASGTTAPSGSVTFAVGSTTLGSVNLTASGSSGTAALTVKAASLKSGSNTITATFSGSTAFSSSSGSVTVTLGSSPKAAVVIASVVPNSVSQASTGLNVAVQLQETAGVSTTITGFTINGTNFTSAIGSFFGSTQLPAEGMLTSAMQIQWKPLPSTLTFAFTGQDASGKAWSQNLAVSTASVL